jgi:phosphate transport system substrate-binding protein
MPRISRFAASVTAAALVTAGTAASASAIPVITMSGSTSVAPLATLLAKKYVQTHNRRRGRIGAAKFKIAQGGSDVGVADVAAGRVTIGNSSRDPKPSDPGGLVFNKIAKDAICVITNPANPIANLTQDQIQAIFSGSVRNWEDVSGSTAHGPIDLTVRTAASGTQDAFQKIFMGSASVSKTAAAKASNGLVQQAVRSDKNAIGYVSLDFVAGTHPAAYKGVACNLANAKSGQYGGVRSFYMVTRGPARGAALRFISWIQASRVANAIIGTHWVPLH